MKNNKIAVKIIIGDLMKTLNILDLYEYDYSVNVINALKQFWKTLNYFCCFGSPKCYNMLLFLDGCKAEYTLKNGEKIYAQKGDIVYTPVGSEYSVFFYDFEEADSNTIGINFLLYDSKNLPFALSDKIEIFRADNANYLSIFNKIDNYCEANIICKGKIKSVMYDLIFKLSEYYRKDYCNKYRTIAKGITYLEQNEEQILKISEIADMCNVSEVYFRKLFKDYSGMSPVEYRITTKICRAKNYLKQDGLTVAEISDRLGFEDVSYFIKQFRERTGVTPNDYRRKFEHKLRDAFS